MVKRVNAAIVVTAVLVFTVATSQAGQDTTKSISPGKEIPAAAKSASNTGTQAAPVVAKDTVAKSQNKEPSPTLPAVKQDAPTTSAPAAAPTKKKAAVSEEEELLLPEKGEELSVKKEAAAKPAADTGEKKAGLQPGAPGHDSAAVQPAVKADSGRAPSVQAAQKPADTLSKKPAEQKQEVVPVKVEEARSINFAKNLKEYRSPKLAMLLSFLVPGLGQTYIGGKVNYIKAGAFFAAEAAIITVSAVFNYKGKKKYDEATHLADSMYSYDSMVTYYNRLDNYVHTKVAGGVDSTAHEILNEAFIDTLNGFKSSYNNGSPTQDYYSTIELKQYVQGWRDCEPTLSQITNLTSKDTIDGKYNRYTNYDTSSTQFGRYSFLVNIIGLGSSALIDNGERQFGYSPTQLTYIDIMRQSNNFYKTSTNVLFAILAVHVASAVDALISARVYNADLLGRQSFWRRIEVEPTMLCTGSETAPGLAMTVRF